MKCQAKRQCVKMPGSVRKLPKGVKWCTGCDKTGKDKEFKKRHKEITKKLKDLAKFEKDSMESFKKSKMQFD